MLTMCIVLCFFKEPINMFINMFMRNLFAFHFNLMNSNKIPNEISILFFILPYTLQKHFHCVLLYKNIYIVFCYTETLQISSYFNIQASKKGIQQISRNKSCIADLIQEWQISCYALYKSKGLIKILLT